MLRRGDGLWDESGRLRASLPEEDAALQKLLARALPFLGGPVVGGSMVVSRPETLSRLVLHVSPVHDAGAGPGQSRIGALVLAVDPADRTGIDPERVGEVLGLTRAESHIAVLLAQGKTIDDIAVETGGAGPPSSGTGRANCCAARRWKNVSACRAAGSIARCAPGGSRSR